jgi:non-canonical (house-cleaning) NTP pyrophosphatase
MSPSIGVPEAIVKDVIQGKRELGVVIDDFAGIRDVRSKQGAWGVLSKNLITLAMGYELGVIKSESEVLR